MGRILRFFLLWSLSAATLLVFTPAAHPQETTFLYETFENNDNNLPSGWINAMVFGNETWKIGEGAGPFPVGQIGLPDTAAFGEKNAYFRVPSFNIYVSRLITPAINLEFAINPELKFWHAQVPRDGTNAKLGVYISASPGGPWTLIASYQNPVHEWTERILQLPGGSSTFYVAFEGHSGQGLGGSVCIDEVSIEETGTLPRQLSAVNSYQPTTFLVSTGSQNNPVLKTELRVIGNTETLNLQSFRAISLNTSDNDIAPNGVKLWFTSTEDFEEPLLLGSAQNFSGGQVNFTGLNHSLPTGYSYLWVTYDIAEDATPGHFVDAMLPSNGMIVNGESFPDSDQSPAGSRKIYETIFYDNFAQDKGWTLSGEWQREEPQGLGGQLENQSNTSGPAGPSVAFSGTHVLGTDITGLGSYPGNYEPMLPPLAYVAVSPEINTAFFTDVRLSFHRWLNVHLFDRASIDMSTDNGTTWTTIWQNQQVQNTSSWNQTSYILPSANRQESVRFRFTLGETGGTNLQSGWHIDNLVVTGTYVTTDVGISDWLEPANTCNLSSQEEVVVLVTNYGAHPTPNIIPLAFSIDNGQTWLRDTLYSSIPVGESIPFTFGPKADFSLSGQHYHVKAKTELPSDQDESNNLFETTVFSVPSFMAPYFEDFHEENNYWASYGQNSSIMRGSPAGSHISSAAFGLYAWVTNPFGNYNTNEFSWLESPCFDLSEMESPVIDFYLNYHTPNGLDGLALEYSTNGGLNWSRLVPDNPALAWGWFNHQNISALIQTTGDGRGWSGISSGWQNIRMVLPDHISNQEAVRFRVIFASQEIALNFEGFAFDMFLVYSAPPDVGVTAFVEPLSSCTLDEEQTITVAIENLGLSAIQAGTIIPVGLDFIHETKKGSEELVLEQALLPGQVVNYTFLQTFDMSAVGSYTLTAYTLLEGDEDFFTPGVFNDTLSVTVLTMGVPNIDLGDDIYTSNPQNLILNAGPGHASYLWQDGSTNQTFQVTSPLSNIYWVTVSDHNDCQATDSVRVVAYDIAVTAIIAPISGCQAPEGEAVQVELTNLGPDTFEPGFEIPLRLYFDEEWLEDFTYALPQTLEPGNSSVASFQSIVNLSANGDYQIDVVQLHPDINPDNDSLHVTISSLGYPIVSLGDTIYTLMPDTLVLDPGSGFASFLWHDGSTNQTFQVTSQHTQTYWVTVFDNQACSATAEVVVATFDAGISHFVSPGNSCSLLEDEPIIIALQNNGVDSFNPGKSFGLKLYQDDTLMAEETLTLTSVWAPSQVIQYTFIQTLDLHETGNHSFAAEITTKDANDANNNLVNEITVHGFPLLEVPEAVVTNQPDTVQLDAGTGHASYNWSTGETSQSIDVSTWGTYTITVTNSFGCETTANIQVTPEFLDLAMHALVEPAGGCENEFVDAAVVVSILNAGNIVIPQGEEIIMHYNANNQALASEQVTTAYTLLPGQTHEFTFSQTLNLAKTNQITFNFWLEHPADENPGNDELEVIVEVLPLPQPSLGDTIINAQPQGIVLELSETYESYLWNDGSSEAQYEITSPLSQHYYVTVTDQNGCANTDSVFVLAYDFEVVELLSPLSNCTLSSNEQVVFVFRNNGPDTFQAGRLFRFGYTINGSPAHYQNFNLASSLGPGQFRTFAFSQGANLQGTGPFEVNVFLDEIDVNTDNNQMQISLDVPGLPLVSLGGDIYTQQPDTVLLDAGDGFAAYLWHNGSTNQTFQVFQYGWHYVMVTDDYGCQNGDTLYIGQSTGLAHTALEGLLFQVFPNPAYDEVSFRIGRNALEQIKLEMLNQTGSIVFERELEPSAIIEDKINLSMLRPGVYYLRLSSPQGVITRKVIKTNRK